VNAASFRALALAMPEAAEGEHAGHPDFRVRGRIFATLGPDGSFGGLKLTPEQQAACVRAAPGVYAPFAGAWGRGGFTRVALRPARVPDVRRAMARAWANAAPRGLARRHLDD
jgi:hypothetical protein